MLTFRTTNCDNLLQIRFYYPDKHETYRRKTVAVLAEKIINPENPDDFVWQEKDKQFSNCNVLADFYDKKIGRFLAFDKLVKNNFDRDSRRDLYSKYFEMFGIPPKIKPTSFEKYLKLRMSGIR